MRARIYRFNSKVAFHLEGSEPVYLTPDKANNIVDALSEAAKDIKQTPNYWDSSLGTTLIT